MYKDFEVNYDYLGEDLKIINIVKKALIKKCISKRSYLFSRES